MLKQNNFSLWMLILQLFIIASIIPFTSQAAGFNFFNNKNNLNVLHFDQDKIKANFIDNALEANIVIANPQALKINGKLNVSLINPNNNTIATIQKPVSLDGNKLINNIITLPTSISKEKLMFHRLSYTFNYKKGISNTSGSQFNSNDNIITGVKSVSSCFNRTAIKILAQKQFKSNAPASVRLIAYDPTTELPVKNAKININLIDKITNDETPLYTGKTNNDGTINANFNMPDKNDGNFDLNINVISENQANNPQVINQPITIKKDYKIMLTTDKPIYQPNQTFKIRALTLNTATLIPITKKEALIEVYDPKGNKVFKHKCRTDNFGITSAEFTLADEVNMGNYKIKATVDNLSSEKSVNVSRYVLPKYKIAFKTDKDYYLPSETIKGSIDANYFFGKPVKNATVKLNIDKFDIGFSRIQEINGKTDTNGHFDFEIQLPDSFVGQNITNGNAFIKFDIEIKDTAEHIEKKTFSKIVSQQPINIAVIPESGKLAKNIKNNIYIMTTYPDGSPANTDIIATINDKNHNIKSDTTGIATIEVKPELENLDITINVKDLKGNESTNTVKLSTDTSSQSILLRTDKALAKVGETINLQAISTKSKGTVYLDIIKNNQTILTKSMDLVNGKAEMPLDISADLVGTIAFNAYIIDNNSEIIKDKKLAYISPAQELSINVNSNKKTYKPAEEATINFKVTDNNKHPVLAALGVYIVDESVFALSELQPGLEKVFFTLEQEILKPRFEIHGLSPENLITKEEKDIIQRKNQQNAAKVLFAATEDLKNYDINIDTLNEEIENTINEYSSLLYEQRNKLSTAVYKYKDKTNTDLIYKDSIDTLITKGYLKSSDIIDPWGNNYVIIPLINNDFCYDFIMISKGPDGKPGTIDDIALSRYGSPLTANSINNVQIFKLAFETLNENNIKKIQETLRPHMYNYYRRCRKGEMLDFAFGDGIAAGAMGVGIKAAMPMAAMQEINEAKKDKTTESSNTTITGDKKNQEVRIREYFPETLYANPSVITDINGNASIKVPLADSITTWRLTSMANSTGGLLGSNIYDFKVFQDFFIDIDFPVSLTQNDTVSVPIAIYNYLPKSQTIKIKVSKEDWFNTNDNLNKELILGPNQVSVEYFTLQVKKLGNHTLTIYANGTQLSDAIKRNVLVEPDGKEFREATNGRLDKNVTHDIVIPNESIDEASKILVKIYPGYLSQVIDGLDKIFQMPYGCFEQTSSTTYPNILVLDYMKRTKQISPEIQMKAESYINSGYQRLLTFEVPGGGFDWFGRAPANKILTAYGLMEFSDMANVQEIDHNLINRTQNWLISKQELNGSWLPDEGGIAEGAINKYKGDTLRTTAYIAWALASSNYKGNSLDKAVNYIKDNLKKAQDPYTYAVIANLMTTVQPDSATTDQVFNSLLKLKTEKDDAIYWDQKEETPMYGGGKSANIETTALATIALINYGKEIGVTNKALNYLTKSKDTNGTWFTTQATILSMKALIMSLGNATSKVNAKIIVGINGKIAEEYIVNTDNSDIVKQIDLKTMTQKGNNTINLSIEGQGSLLYQIIKVNYVPWKLLTKPEMPLLSIAVDYDKTSLVKNDTATAQVTVQNNVKETANMVIVDLGIPPGFEIDTSDLDKLVKNKVITKYSIAARQIILYFDKIEPQATVKFEYKLKAKISIKAKTGKSKIYKYYQPEINNTAEPIEINVK